MNLSHAREMKLHWFLSLLAVIGCLCGVGCGNAEVQSAPPQAVLPELAAGKPQPKLPTIKLWMGSKEVVAEQAIAESEIRAGMMFRTEMDENEGMIFVLPFPQRASFWMRNTLIPLSCAYIGIDGEILEIHDMKPKDETPILANSNRIQYVLEMKQGWFDRNGIKVGTIIRTERGTLAETYLGSRQ